LISALKQFVCVPREVFGFWKLPRPLSFWWVFGVAFLLVGIKDGYQDLIYPQLFQEDGRILFSTFFNDHQIKNIFNFYAGYIQFLPSLLGYLIHFLPLEWIPYAYAFFSYLLTTTAIFLMYCAIARVYGNRYLALGLLVMVAVVPWGDFEFVSTLMYQIWNCLLILVFLLFLPLPSQRTLRMGYSLGVACLILSHPLCVLLLPCYVYRWQQDKKHRPEYGLFMLITLMYLIFGVRSGDPSLSGLGNFPGIFASRVVVESLVGPVNRAMLGNLQMGWVLALFVGIYSGTRFIMAWGNMSLREKEFAVGAFYFMVMVLGMSLVGRPDRPWENFHLLGSGMRYVYISKIICLILFAVALHYHFQNFVLARGWGVAFVGMIVFFHSSSMFLYEVNIARSVEIGNMMGLVAKNNFDCVSGQERFLFLDSNSTLSYQQSEQWNLKMRVCPP